MAFIEERQRGIAWEAPAVRGEAALEKRRT